jgi:hypothetical protein
LAGNFEGYFEGSKKLKYPKKYQLCKWPITNKNNITHFRNQQHSGILCKCLILYRLNYKNKKAQKIRDILELGHDFIMGAMKSKGTKKYAKNGKNSKNYKMFGLNLNLSGATYKFFQKSELTVNFCFLKNVSLFLCRK